MATRAEALACRLYPHRATLCAVGLGCFLIGAFPLVVVAQGRAALAAWHVLLFASSVPIVLWALCLAIHATFFDPTRGLVATFCRTRISPRPWVRGLMRAYATLTVAAFAVAPVVVLVAAVA
jgi:hypothetical protein